MNVITVGQYGKGQCETIAKAFELAMSMEGHVEIRIANGIYYEKLELKRDNVTIIGEDVFNTVITYDDYAKKLDATGAKYGTFKTFTFKLIGNNIVVKNLTVKNEAGNGRDYGQAVAMDIDGDYNRFYNCRFIACQDTLFMAPHPEKYDENNLPIEKATAIGPHRLYFKNCYIEGDIDFIFGGATAYFDKCEIFSRYNITEDDDKYEGRVKGYVTAACTHADTRIGFVFLRCSFNGDCPKDSVYLGRPWRHYARTILIECEIFGHIKKDGWHDWDKEFARETTYYGEYNCRYEEDIRRANWINMMSKDEALQYTIKNIFTDNIKED